MRIIPAVLLSLTLSGPVLGATVLFTDRGAFRAAAGAALSFESFEVAPPSWSDTYVFSGFSVSETNGINALTNTLINSLFTACVTDGRGAIWYDDNGDSISTFFAFTAPVNAFGLDITADEVTRVTVGGSVSTTLDLAPNIPKFFGVIDDSAYFTSISFDASGGPNVGFDAVDYGAAAAAVPEPTAVMIWGFFASLGICLTWWQRKRAT